MSENNLCVAHNPWPTCPNCAIEILNTRLDEAKKENGELHHLLMVSTPLSEETAGKHYVARIEKLESALAARDEEIERLGTELANYDFRFIQKERENSNLRMALAARDVIIGVKDGALNRVRNLLQPFARPSDDKGGLGEYILQKEIRSKDLYFVDKAISIDPNEVAEAVEGMRESIENIHANHTRHAPNGFMSEPRVTDEQLGKLFVSADLYDKALKGIK